MRILFQPDLLFADGRFVSGAGLIEENGKVVRITGPDQARSNSDTSDAGKVVRLSGKALLPGFVNVHSHSFQRLIRGRTESRQAGGKDFWSWRGAIYHAAATLSPEEMYRVARMAFIEMALSGITTVGEFHYVHRMPDGQPFPDPNLMARQVIAAAKSVGVRIALLRTAYQRAGHKLPPDAGQARFLETTGEFLANVAALHSEFHSSDAWVGVAPHSVRAVPLPAIEEIASWARERGLPLHMHVAEQLAEVGACQREYGSTPVRLLERQGILSDKFTAVHAMHSDGEDMDLIAGSGATICSCPTTERNLGDGIFPARQAMARGIRIAFGSDSQAQIDPLEDARELEYHLRLAERQRSLLDGIAGQEMSARLFRCATANGAVALGFDGGELRAGNPADFFTIDLDDPSIAGNSAEDLLPMIVFGMNRTAIADVAVGGRFIVRDHRHAQQREVLNEYREVHRRVWAIPQPVAK